MSTEDIIAFGLLAIGALSVLLLSVYLRVRVLGRALKAVQARLLGCECELSRLKAANDGVHGQGRN